MLRRMHRGLACLLLAALILSWSAAGARAEKTLRWKFTPGETIKQVMTQEMEIGTGVGDKPMTRTMKQVIDMQWQVEKVEGDVADVVQSITRVRMDITAGPGMDVSIDTDDKSEKEGAAALIAPALEALTKAKFNVKINTLGEPKDVQISEDVIEALKKLGPAGGMFSKERMEQTVRDASMSFPEAAVSEGETWSRKYEMKMPPAGTMKVVQTMKYEGEEKVAGQTLEKIGIELKMTLDAGEAPGGATIELKDQKASGTIYFDNSAGRITSSAIDQVMTMEIALGGKTVEQTINQKVKIEFAATAPEKKPSK